MRRRRRGETYEDCNAVLLLQLSNGQTATSPSRSDLESGAHSQTGQYETRKDLSAEAVEEGEIGFAAKNGCCEP
jgi:hypothetical protein